MLAGLILEVHTPLKVAELNTGLNTHENVTSNWHVEHWVRYSVCLFFLFEIGIQPAYYLMYQSQVATKRDFPSPLDHISWVPSILVDMCSQDATMSEGSLRVWVQYPMNITWSKEARRQDLPGRRISCQAGYKNARTKSFQLHFPMRALMDLLLTRLCTLQISQLTGQPINYKRK